MCRILRCASRTGANCCKLGSALGVRRCTKAADLQGSLQADDTDDALAPRIGSSGTSKLGLTRHYEHTMNMTGHGESSNSRCRQTMRLKGSGSCLFSRQLRPFSPFGTQQSDHPFSFERTANGKQNRRAWPRVTQRKPSKNWQNRLLRWPCLGALFYTTASSEPEKVDVLASRDIGQPN